MSLETALLRAEARYHLRMADMTLGHYERTDSERFAALYMDLSNRHVAAYERITEQLGHHI